ncbi:hypothetical protein SPRG_07013 [Saprolegnia parasitica CBS 223.65]|uniref:Etoposide-induced protein 2.4 n=1 Tax=Saprolegnia parasitica (strain CBS 223.65) TaxID=695850 RepID=A0A067CE14_SAPPC|nr:hypothetical protein SPRG_07013 [Saprolegnia parasitica CBS 223.65]KDO27425.1 hypothetical protein SPRG_07013 [Saprolegnia parasitica CBS 223.65]|eukprot:XP_012201865.1 hypothetical protein SPRG_07013 [Saprolegnia parasitica CBS 223.65]
MEVVQEVYTSFCAGIQDAISLHRIATLFWSSPIIRKCSAKCLGLNGLLFLGSIFFFEFVVMPVIHLFGDVLTASLSQHATDIASDYYREQIDLVVFVLYQGLWMYPIYCISFILNTIWYQDIADDAYLLHYGQPRPTAVREMIRDELYRAILVAFFLGQTMLSYFVPVVGPFLSFVYLSWLYALYCFEYKWSLHGWGLEKRLAIMEQHWAYFAGFGCPFTLATFFAPNFISKGLFAVFFPVVRCKALIGCSWRRSFCC